MNTPMDMMAQYNRFGYEWNRYRAILPAYERQFLAWVHPLEASDFEGLHILDAGCGTGRNSLWPLRYGAASVCAFDIDPRSVEVARQNLDGQDRAAVEQHSIYELPYSDRFDLVFSIGVVHHLEEPRRAVEQLVRAARPGGRILLWVYGRHGAAGLKRLIRAILPLSSRIPPGLLNILVSPLSLLMWGAGRLPWSRHPYLLQFRQTPFWHVHSIVFDQFLPRISNYWTKEEALGLFDGLPVRSVEAHDCNRGSWTVVAEKAS